MTENKSFKANCTQQITQSNECTWQILQSKLYIENMRDFEKTSKSKVHTVNLMMQIKQSKLHKFILSDWTKELQWENFTNENVRNKFYKPIEQSILYKNNCTKKFHRGNCTKTFP